MQESILSRDTLYTLFCFLRMTFHKLQNIIMVMGTLHDLPTSFKHSQITVCPSLCIKLVLCIYYLCWVLYPTGQQRQFLYKDRNWPNSVLTLIMINSDAVLKCVIKVIYMTKFMRTKPDGKPTSVPGFLPCNFTSCTFIQITAHCFYSLCISEFIQSFTC